MASAPTRNLRVGDLLLEHGLVSEEQIEQALAFQRNRGHKKLLGEVLVELEFVSEQQVMEVLAEAYGVPFVHLTPRLVDGKCVEILPREFIEKNHVLPLFLVEGKLTLAIPEPSNVFLIEEVERITSSSVQVVCATVKDIDATIHAIHNRVGNDAFVIDELVNDLQNTEVTVIEAQFADLSDLENMAGDSPVIKLANYLIYMAVQEAASDIHIEPDENAVRVRYRVDGRLYEKMRPPHGLLPALVSRIKIMAGLDISERRVPQDGAITVIIDRNQVDLRVSTLPGKFGEKVVMRIIDKRNSLVSLDKLGFSYPMLESWRNLINMPNGIVLVTGPTGSGKSTTLYAALNAINTEDVNISTVEDPVEQNIIGVNQFQVNERAGFNFSNALRSLLRQDPDIIMLGEIRDQETARIATQAALTGHMVLSTLHTNDAVSAVTRLTNMGVESYLTAASVRGVLAQRLVRKVCPECKDIAPIDTATRNTLDRLADGGPPVETIYQGTGCKRCRNTGYSGRLGVYELYIPDDESLDAISRGATLQELRQLARSGTGYTTLRQDGLDKIKAGLTTVEELLTATAM
ncbi:MAG: Flp pilus assembly complex ATPase component TadA [Phycisphaeraceae bacterium]|nr:Flp pilus assembly complex ATPase component TadA [Phycisphaeraceae bacterium]